MCYKIFRVMLYGYEALVEECRLRVFENRILRRIFGPKVVSGEWPYSLYRSLNIPRVIKSIRLMWAGHVARIEESRGVFKILIGNPTWKRSLGRLRHRWEDNTRIKMDVKEIGITMRNCLDSTQDSNYWRALVNAALNLRVP